jgi:hypothetical protein
MLFGSNIWFMAAKGSVLPPPNGEPPPDLPPLLSIGRPALSPPNDESLI